MYGVAVVMFHSALGRIAGFVGAEKHLLASVITHKIHGNTVLTRQDRKRLEKRGNAEKYKEDNVDLTTLGCGGHLAETAMLIQ